MVVLARCALIQYMEGKCRVTEEGGGVETHSWFRKETNTQPRSLLPVTLTSHFSVLHSLV